MEEIFVVIVQVIVEVVFEALFSLPIDVFFWGHQEDRPEKVRRTALFSVGCLMGWASIFALPGTILHHGWLRVANLVVAPLLAGWLATVIAHWLIDKRHKDASPKIQFWRAWWFTLGFSLLRFAYAQGG